MGAWITVMVLMLVLGSLALSFNNSIVTTAQKNFEFLFEVRANVISARIIDEIQENVRKFITFLS